ncbi:GIY-YIG nuclease family protein [candidate division WWE3 bacterium]|uniref:GIY-YIG nuclease family protein n=1 Tax=candidate division WWE3 bacterium TaxID=2053526 RepID=A0A7X9HGL3_UNCKA|nr:GIY-YIG nuclease family protein [candidate division WWE3 bacterium]
MTVKEKVRALPLEPGVYLFKDIKGTVIYVGKAKQLKNRVSSYFQSGILPGTKTYALVSRIADMEHIQVESELEALILESDLIKKYRPHYNIIQKDDRTYLYIVIRPVHITTSGGEATIWSVFTARETDLKARDVIYGPYPDGGTAKEILRKLRPIFQFKDCSETKFSRFKKMGRPCLYGHLNLCTAPCIYNEPKDIAIYTKNIKNLKAVLSGKSKNLLNQFKKGMDKASKAQRYEDAIYYRDMMEKYKYVSSKFRSSEKYILNPYLIDDLAEKALKNITLMIPILKSVPKRIECYDISNVSGKEAVGSMVVAVDGKVNKREYKRFKIKRKDSPNDFFMMQEVLERRLLHSIPDTKKVPWPVPDLLVIDGGKGQVSAVLKVVKNLNLDIPVVGLAKRFESLVYKTQESYVIASFPKDTEGMKLIIRLRDEAHRFAQAYHHMLRAKKFID